MMRRMCVWILVTLFSVVSEWCGHCYGCLEEERISLLEIQASFDPNRLSLTDWVDNKDGSANCCEWSGINCDNTTSRVIQLSLLYVRAGIGFDDLILNASLFLPLQKLQSLNFRGNKLVGWFENQGFEVLSSKLRKLEILDLSENQFDDNILSSLAGFSSLTSLHLSYNDLTGSAGFYGFKVLASRLKKLKNLDLAWNEYNHSGIFPFLSGFSSLKSLDLSGNMLNGSTNIDGSFFNSSTLEELFLDYSSLSINFFQNIRALPALKVLSLNECELNGPPPIQGLCELKNLEQLYLSRNNIGGFLPACLGNISSLRQLDVSGNQFTGNTILLNGFKVLASRLKKLENLDLSWNKYNDISIFSSLSGFSSLKSLNLSGNFLKGSASINGSFFTSATLEELFLDYSSLPLNFLQNIRALPALKVLSLRECELDGTLQGLCELKNLKQLYLSGNNLGGLLPACLGNMSSLSHLDVSGNQFTGNIAYSPLTSLISLEFLSLSYNHFEVPLSFKSFMNHSSLKFFLCDNNKLIAEPAFHNLIPKFQLLVFSLANSTSKTLNSEIPNFFYNQYDLRSLDLSHNNFSGMFPSWLLKNNSRLEQLHLRENSFVGPLQLQNNPNPNVTVIDISNNNMYGQIPRNMCLLFPNLWMLRMAKNGLTGCIPSCFGNWSSLSYLDLSDNQLSTAKLEQLTTLDFIMLSNNKLGGQISPLLFNSSTLTFLYLDGNNFWGQISDFSPTGGLQLAALDLSNNQFSGMLPKWIGNVSFVEAIDLSQNHFEGPIPQEFCNVLYLYYLDLSENNLSGSIPSCFNPQYITHVHLSNNRLIGPLKDAFYNSSFLVTLDLADNNFTGSIPNWIGNLTSLSVLLLKANHFDGEFSTQLCLLEHLSILDVSQNKLSGPLPSCLGNFTLKASPEIASMGSLMFFGSKSTIAMYVQTMRPRLVESIDSLESSYPAISIEESIEFTTKTKSYGYRGNILTFMSGFDLSNNRFSGEIPLEIGNLSEIRALNLSHNNLTGTIPATFSNLKLIESLDLSCNNLNGGIPLQLTEMTTLEVFSVAHNNLSGRTPERKYQFGTFGESSYEGNPFLCGPPLQNNCSEEQSPSQPMPNDEQEDGQEDDGSIDMDAFYVSFGICYLIVVLEIAAVLYFNSNLRRRWFYFIEDCIDAYYNFVVNSFCKFSEFKLLLKHV